MSEETEKKTGVEICNERGWHDYEECIDPKSGGYVRCKDCGHTVDCEDPDGDI